MFKIYVSKNWERMGGYDVPFQFPYTFQPKSINININGLQYSSPNTLYSYLGRNSFFWRDLFELKRWKSCEDPTHSIKHSLNLKINTNAFYLSEIFYFIVK